MKKASNRGTSAEHRKSGGALLIVGAALASQGQVVQAADDGTAAEFEEVIVTASRRSETLQDTALSVIPQTPDELAVAGLTSLSDVLD